MSVLEQQIFSLCLHALEHGTPVYLSQQQMLRLAVFCLFSVILKTLKCDSSRKRRFIYSVQIFGKLLCFELLIRHTVKNRIQGTIETKE